ncbi:heparan-alpha-glucosaminide N-acetyltransferase domain-containing protein [Microbacterium amylolyticum]|nr:heparan-alpha-glucosaminide N-acetyltransferase domain-containing protein [Microbacterium amylolyticum]
MRFLRRASLDAPGRESGVDLARGLAVFGMFAAHVVTMPTEAFTWSDPATWVQAVNGTSSILFATLAGVSLALLTGGNRRLRGAAMTGASWRIVVRAVMIWIIGVLLVFTPVPVYVILPAYGVLFLVAIPLLRLRTGVVIATSVTAAIVMPFVVYAINDSAVWAMPGSDLAADLLGWHYPFVLWIAFIAAGIAIGRARMSRPRVAIALVMVGSGLAVLGRYVIGAREQAWPVLSAAPHSGGIGEAVGTGGLAVAIIAGCVLMCRTPVRYFVWPIRAIGSMPLTAYVAQLMVWNIWIWREEARTEFVDPIAGFVALEPFWPLTVGILLACSAWAWLVGRGPLEWVLAVTARAIVPESAGRARRSDTRD